MWENVFYGNSFKDWTISLAVIVGALLLNKLIQILNVKVFQKLAARTKTRFDDILFRSLESPVLLGILLIAIWVALNRLETPDKFHAFLSNAYHILTTLNVTWFFARLLTSLIDEKGKATAEKEAEKIGKRFDIRFMPLVRRTILYLVWTIGGVMALKNGGYDVKTLIGALGIGGVAIALAAQDTMKNLLAGITIFVDRPFLIGDLIRFSGFDGFVEDIGLRSTRIRTLDNRLLTVPNYKVMDDAIENVDSEPMRKVILKLGLTYDTTPEKMNEAMDLLKTLPQRVSFVSSGDLVVAFTEFGDFSLGITFIYYIEKEGGIYQTMSNVNMDILSTFNNAGLNFAFPTQTLYVEKA